MHQVIVNVSDIDVKAVAARLGIPTHVVRDKVRYYLRNCAENIAKSPELESMIRRSLAGAVKENGNDQGLPQKDQ